MTRLRRDAAVWPNLCFGFTSLDIRTRNRLHSHVTLPAHRHMAALDGLVYYC